MRSTRAKEFSANRAGFSLVVTISVMVLLTVVAVGLLTLSSASLRTASQGQAAAEARANARLALMLAIGELQTELGPDQRINAPADLANQSLGGGRQKWVGTWDSWPANDTKRPDPQFRRWLVSGPPESLGNLSFPSEASNLVSLMRGKNSDLMAAPGPPPARHLPPAATSAWPWVAVATPPSIPRNSAMSACPRDPAVPPRRMSHETDSLLVPSPIASFPTAGRTL